MRTSLLLRKPRPGIGGKLFLSFLSMALLVAALSIAAGRNTAALEENLKRLTEELIPVLTDLESLSRSVTELSGEALSPRRANPAQGAEERLYDHQQTVVIAADGMLNGSLASLDMLLVERYRDRWKVAKEKVLALRSHAMNLLSARTDPSIDEIERLEDAQDDAMLALQEIRLLTVKELNERHSEADFIQRRSVMTHWAALLLSLAAALVLSIVFTNQFVQPILALRQGTGKISAGDFDARVDVGGEDELADLGHSFNRMAEALQTTTVSKASVEAILSTMSEPLCVVDGPLIIRQTNRAWEHRFGPAEKSSLGQRLEQFWPELAVFVLDFRRNMTPDAAEEKREIALEGGAARRQFEVSVKRMTEGPGSGSAILIVANDVTDRRQAEAELQAFRDRLMHAEQLASLGSVAAILSHKLNQPLTVLRLLVQQMLRNLDSREIVQKKLETAREEIDVVSGQIREVLQYARPIDSQHRKILDLGALIQKTVELFARTFEEQKIEFRLQGVEYNPQVEGNEDQLAEVVYILLENAVHAVSGTPNPEICLRLRPRDGDLVISVADNGHGIPAAVAGRVFEPFFTTKPASRGTGLGLARLKQILTAHDGETWIESEEGKGTTVHFSLPVAKGEEVRYKA